MITLTYYCITIYCLFLSRCHKISLSEKYPFICDRISSLLSREKDKGKFNSWWVTNDMWASVQHRTEAVLVCRQSPINDTSQVEEKHSSKQIQRDRGHCDSDTTGSWPDTLVSYLVISQQQQQPEIQQQQQQTTSAPVSGVTAPCQSVLRSRNWLGFCLTKSRPGN